MGIKKAANCSCFPRLVPYLVLCFCNRLIFNHCGSGYENRTRITCVRGDFVYGLISLLSVVCVLLEKNLHHICTTIF